MKKILIIISLAAISISSCKVAQPIATTICSIAQGVCPIIDALVPNQTVTLTPVKNNTKMVMVSGNGIVTTVCSIINGLCPIIETALANGQAVSLTPVTESGKLSPTSPGAANSKKYIIRIL